MKTNNNGQIIQNKNGGYRRITNTGSSTVLLVNCKFCGKQIFRNKCSLKKHEPFCSELCRSKNKEPRQYDIMSKINEPNFYYLIGLICTDGHISYPFATHSNKSNYYCDIKIHNQDQSLIDNIFKYCGGIVRKEKNQICWRTSCKEFIQYLINIGLTNNKSLTLNVDKWFNNLKDEYKCAFIRGAIDGDGCISNSVKSNSYGANICSASLSFITMIFKYFNNDSLKITERKPGGIFKHKNGIIIAKNSLYYIYIPRTKIIPLLHPIYKIDENCLFLERKYNTYNDIVKLRQKYN